MSQTRVQLIGDSFDTGAIFDGTVSAIDVDISSNAVISGIATVGELLTPQIKTDVISNESGTGPIELKEGAVLPDGKNLSGNGSIIISGTATVGELSSPEIKTNAISNESGTGPIELKEGAILPAGKILNGDGDINISGNVTIGGLLTYEDVTNIDSVGLITARSGIEVTGGGLNVDGDIQKKGNAVPSAVIGTSAPSNPSICDFWTDTSGEDPILKSWNGTEWIEVGSSTPSEFAPVISNVTLTENDTAGNRFTSQTFDVDITMLVEGAPHSQKALKGEVTAEFSQHPNTEQISINAVTTYPNLQRTSTTMGYSNSAFYTRVWGPDTSGGSTWYFITSNNSGYYTVSKNSVPGNSTGGTYATQIYNSGANSGAHYSQRSEYFAPSGSNPNHYIITSEDGYGFGGHLIMRKGETGEWDFNITYSMASSHPAYNSDDGEFAYVRNSWGGNPRYHMDLKVGTTPFSEDISTNTWTTSGDGHGHAVAYGNGHYVVAWKNSSTQNRVEVSKFTKEGTFVSTVQAPNGSGRSVEFFKFEKDYFWLYVGGNILLRSSDGTNWTEANGGDGVNGFWPVIDIIYDVSTNKYVLKSGGSVISVYESNNSGATWVRTKQHSVSNLEQIYPTQTPENDIYIRDVTYGDSKILYSGWDSNNYYEVTYPYNAQLLTLSGTGADYSDFNVGDIIRPVGQYEFPYRGVIKSISGADFEISSDYVYQIGDIVEAVNPTNSQVSTRYLAISETGVVTGTIGSDPGYVPVGPDTNQTLTFPVTFNTGNAPDDDLPAGATLKVSAQATNSIGSSDFGPSNIITPA